MTTAAAIALKERIAICTDFTPDERTLLLDAVNFYTEDRDFTQHYYPPNYPRDSSIMAVRLALEVMDQLPPGALSCSGREWLCGMIAAKLAEAYSLGGRAARGGKQ
jgi:hypothetical protein